MTILRRKNTSPKQNKVLRYIATLENGKAEVKLQAVSQNHPFFQLSENDNIISITTKRYSNTPLVIKGPGARCRGNCWWNIRKYP